MSIGKFSLKCLRHISSILTDALAHVILKYNSMEIPHRKDLQSFFFPANFKAIYIYLDSKKEEVKIKITSSKRASSEYFCVHFSSCSLSTRPNCKQETAVPCSPIPNDVSLVFECLP